MEQPDEDGVAILAREREMSTARDRVAAAAQQHGWAVFHNTDRVWNVRIYTRGDRTVLVGYTESGSVTGASRMFDGADKPPRKDSVVESLSSRDRGKFDTVLGWLAEPV